MSYLTDDVRAAKNMGLSYGQYKALTYRPTMKTPCTSAGKRRQPPKRPKRYADEVVFAMWQDGLTDSEIGAAVGVSRQVIQTWRDNLELPSTHKLPVDTKKYRLVKQQDGTYIALKNDSEF